MKIKSPPLINAGGVKPWVQKFNSGSPKTFMDKFVTLAEARLVEIKANTHDDITYDSKLLRDEDTKEWPDLSHFFKLPGADGQRDILRIVILPFNTEAEDFPPLSWKGFQEHIDLLNLQGSFVCDEDMKTPPSWFEVPLEGGLKGFIIKPERWDSNLANFSLSVVYSPTTRATSIVAHMLHKADVEHLLKRLPKLKSNFFHPLLVPLIFMEKRIEGTVQQLTLIRDSLYSVEKRTGTHKNYHRSTRYENLNYNAYGNKVWEKRHVKDVAFDAAPGDLTSIVSDCAMFEAKCLINESLLDWLNGLNASFCALQTHRAIPPTSANSIRMKTDALKMWCGNNRTRSIYLAKRAEAQMQACLNLMAQRDSDLNLRGTAAALRDSADMRVIAWVTLAFLPATFVATFFSTSFFTFEQEGRRVSEWIWLYVVVSVALTVGVIAGWTWWGKKDARRED